MMAASASSSPTSSKDGDEGNIRWFVDQNGGRLFVSQDHLQTPQLQCNVMQCNVVEHNAIHKTWYCIAVCQEAHTFPWALGAEGSLRILCSFFAHIVQSIKMQYIAVGEEGNFTFTLLSIFYFHSIQCGPAYFVRCRKYNEIYTFVKGFVSGDLMFDQVGCLFQNMETDQWS